MSCVVSLLCCDVLNSFIRSPVWFLKLCCCERVCSLKLQKFQEEAVWFLIWCDCTSTLCGEMKPCFCLVSTCFLIQAKAVQGGSRDGRREGEETGGREGGREGLDSLPVADINNILFSSVLDIFTFFCKQFCSHFRKKTSRNVFRAELSGPDRSYKEAEVFLFHNLARKHQRWIYRGETKRSAVVPKAKSSKSQRGFRDFRLQLKVPD